MKGNGRQADSGVFARVLSDIAQVLESAQGAAERLRGALQLLRKLVPYQQCALLEAEPGSDPRLTDMPVMRPEEKGTLTAALLALFGKMLEERALSPQLSPLLRGTYLAVPVIGLDEVVGVLFVRRESGAYQKRELRVLSLVAAQLACYLMVLRARADERRIARDLLDARNAARRAQRVRDELVNLVAYEMRTPFAALMAWVRLLGTPDLEPELRMRAIETIERSARTQARLVGDMIDFSSASVWDLRLDLRPVDPARCIEAAVEALRPLAERRAIRLETALDASVPPVAADAERLDEVLAVLLANAFEFTPDGGHVQVLLQPAGGFARIQVTDSGRAIAAGRLQHLLDDVTSEDKRAARSDGRFAIARQLVELHGGRIRAGSPGDEKGATVIVELPNLTLEPVPPG